MTAPAMANANALLADVLAAVGHLDLMSLHYGPTPGRGVEVTMHLQTCAGYEAAKTELAATRTGERDTIAGVGARFREAEFAHGVIAHVCWSHFDCWVDPCTR